MNKKKKNQNVCRANFIWLPNIHFSIKTSYLNKWAIAVLVCQCAACRQRSSMNMKRTKRRRIDKKKQNTTTLELKMEPCHCAVCNQYVSLSISELTRTELRLIAFIFITYHFIIGCYRWDAMLSIFANR